MSANLTVYAMAMTVEAPPYSPARSRSCAGQTPPAHENERIRFMDRVQRDIMARTLTTTGSRRALVGLSLASVLGLVGRADTAAKRGHKKHKKHKQTSRTSPHQFPHRLPRCHRPRRSADR